MRISKDGDVRKQELLDAALDLFYSKGYDNTSINDILEKVGISKGTFYYYFNSKDELLDGIAFQLADKILKMMEEIIDDKSLNSLEKFNKIMWESQKIKSTRFEANLKLAKMLYDEDNIKLRNRIIEKTVQITKPLLIKLFDSGNREGVFDIPFPEETAEMYIRMSEPFMRLTIPYFDSLPDSIEQIKRNYVFINRLIERLLGVEKNSIKLAEYVIALLEQISLKNKNEG